MEGDHEEGAKQICWSVRLACDDRQTSVRPAQEEYEMGVHAAPTEGKRRSRASCSSVLCNQTLLLNKRGQNGAVPHYSPGANGIEVATAGFCLRDPIS